MSQEQKETVQLPKEVQEKVERVRKALQAVGKLIYGDYTVVEIETRQSVKKGVVVLKTEDGKEIVLHPSTFRRAYFRIP